MVVLKFGGSSVADEISIGLLREIVSKRQEQKLIVVVSALGGITDDLIATSREAANKNADYRSHLQQIILRHQKVAQALNIPVAETAFESIFDDLSLLFHGVYLLGECSLRASDAILSSGELLSSSLVAATLRSSGLDSEFKDSRDLIATDSQFGAAVVNFEITNKNIATYFESAPQKITVLPGFIARSAEGLTTTLGRGGSDYSAAIIAAAVNATVLEIWTDVNGMYTANPKIVAQAVSMDFLSYHEAMELSHFGAKVLYPPTIQPVLQKKIPILIKNTFDSESNGTFISEAVTGDAPVKGISHIDRISLLTIEGTGIVGIAGTSKRLFSALALHKINVVFITQASSEHSICLGVLDSEAQIAKTAIDLEFENEIILRKIQPCTIENGLAIIALVGDKMKSHQGLSGKMFSTLGRNNVNIRAIAQGASERNISAVIDSRDVRKAINALHEQFFEDQLVQLNLFIMGVGNVGERFLNQIATQQDFLRENRKLQIRVIGLANSRKLYIDPDGINLQNWKELISNSGEANQGQFLDKASELNLRNSVFIDITANENIAGTYGDYLKRNIAVVTCNKIACASKYENYSFLKILSGQYNAPFLFETNVGAGLPIIDTLKNLVASGDKIHKIQAVLSGSLNFIFNNYGDKFSFAETVNQAGIEGFTEPDPKIDLSGIDVARKLLILIRESGYIMEMDDISITPFLPPDCLATENVEEFMHSLRLHNNHFETLYADANRSGNRLKYVASFEDGVATTGLQEIPADHPFYNIEGKDNIVLFYTDRYTDQPLLIKGAGAGAEVTASGIFADVIRIGNI